MTVGENIRTCNDQVADKNTQASGNIVKNIKILIKVNLES